MRTRAIFLAAALMTGGCATGGGIGPVDVTRFSLGAPIAPGTVYVEPGRPGDLSTQAYLPPVGAQLARLGYPASSMESAGYIAVVDIERDTREGFARRSPVSVGVGGSTGSYGSGVGLGIGINLGGGSRRDTVTRMSVKMKRRLGGDVVWEGRAQTESGARVGAAATADRLASALFRDFPGESGRTIRVP